MRFGLFLLCWLTVLTLRAQIRVEVTVLPALSPTASGLFMSGTFNDWSPGDPRFQFTRQANGRYSLVLPPNIGRDKPFEYKFTQGSWQLAEGDTAGLAISNRQYTPGQPRLIQATIVGWERKPAYQFVVTELPPNTPHDAVLYITGTFNKWNPGDPRYRLVRQVDGTYRVTVESDAPYIDYKFTRGNWDSVEGRENGKARANRRSTRIETGNQDIDIHILNWEDLSGTFNFFSIYDLLMLFSAFQGLLLLIAIPSIQNYNRAANRWLVVLIGMASLFVFLKVITSYRAVAQANAKLLLLPDFIWFLYAPLFYFYLRRLLFDTRRPMRNWTFHFIPVVVQFFAYLPYLLMDSKDFQLKLVNHDPTLRGLFLVMGLLALAFNSGYWLVCRRTIRAYKRHNESSISYEQNLNYLNTVLTIQSVCLLLWAFLYVLIAVSQGASFELVPIAERNVDAIYLAFSTITYFLGYVAVHQPEIFKLPQPRPAASQPAVLFEEVVSPLIEEPTEHPAEPAALAALDVLPAPETRAARPAPLPDLEALQQLVDAHMIQQKPYTNPNLTIHELAGNLRMPPHTLSRVINEGFGKNFFDFVNQFRVEELKQRMDDPRSRNYTLLSLAFDVGFNSKTAFNRAFKKLTGQTPKEYFNMVSDEQLLS